MRHMKKKLITQSDDLIAQGVAKKLIRIGDDGKRIEYLRHEISRDWTKPEASRPKVNELSESKQSILLLSFARLVLSSRAFVVGGL